MDWQIAAIILILSIALVFIRPSTRHARNIRAAKKAIHKIRAIPHPAQQMAYLRKMSPYTFEELVLTAYQGKGYKIERSKRYSGDGGIDGKIYRQSEAVLIQSKRYRKHINPRHVEMFAKICASKKAHGHFVHTGRTGKKSWEQISTSKNVSIVSGDKLLKLITETTKVG